MFTKLNVSLNEHGGNGENCVWVFNFSLHCLELTVIFFSYLTQSDNSMNELHLRLLFQSGVGVGDED